MPLALLAATPEKVFCGPVDHVAEHLKALTSVHAFQLQPTCSSTPFTTLFHIRPSPVKVLRLPYNVLQPTLNLFSTELEPAIDRKSAAMGVRFVPKIPHITAPPTHDVIVIAPGLHRSN
jgi:hypothetical protein